MGEERIQPLARLLDAAHRRDQARHVLLRQPLVLPGGALVEPVVGTRVVAAMRRDVERAAFDARTRETAETERLVGDLGIPDHAPVAAAFAQRRGDAGFAERSRHLRQRAIAQGVFQRGRTAVVLVHIHALRWIRAVVRYEALRQIRVVAGTALRARHRRRPTVRVLPQRLPGLAFAALQRAETPQVDQPRRDRIAGHDVGVEVRIAPARQPAHLRVDRQHRAGDVARARRLEHRQQLVLRAVGVPQRKILVVGPALGDVDGLVVTTIAAVGIAAGHRLQEGVVQRGIEHHPVVRRCAIDAHHAQFLAPCGLRLFAHRIECEQLARALAFGIEVAARTFRIDMRDRAGRGDAARAAQLETQPRAVRDIPLRAHAMPASGNAALAIPGAEGLERTIELDAEPGGVLLAAAEALGDQLAFHRTVTDDLDHAAHDFMLLVGLTDVDQHMADLLVRSVGVTLRRGTGQRGRFDIDAVVIGEPDLVVAGLADLARVRVRGGVGLVVERPGLRIIGIEVATGTDAASDRQRGDLPALLPATGPRHERMTEPADLPVVVAIAGVMLGDRADLDHPEWRGRAGKGVALVLGADERVHLQRRIGRRRQRGHARQQAGHRQHSPDACLFPHRPPRFDGMRTLAGSPASSTRC